jgi:MoaA/NifB/PqqE/SkfB family radical SAM enzyme
VIRRHHLSQAARFLARRFHALHPYEVQALLLNACNLKCAYCRCPEIKVPTMTTEQWRGIIRDLAALGTMRIKFQGGEPTLRSDFVELCATARRAGITTAAVTNGIRIAQDPTLLAELDEVVVSLDAVTPAIHDGIRGAGSHAAAVAAILAARTRGLPTYVVMVASRSSVAEVEAMLRFCEERGVRLHVQPVLFGRNSFDPTGAALALDEEQVRTLHRHLAAWKREGRPLMFSASTYAGVNDWADHTVLTRQSSGDSACMAGRFYIHIEANGDVWPCQQHGATFTAKNILRDGLEDALRHVQHHNCADCFTVYLNERKAVFGLRPAALMEVVRRG